MRLYNGVRLIESGYPSVRNVEKIDLGALPMIAEMQKNGLRVDLDHFAKMGIELQRDMENITEQVRKSTGYYVNINSGDQVAEMLFKKMGLKQSKAKMTRGGANKASRESVEDEVLTAIQHEHPCIPMMLKFKEYSKLKGTYVDPMPKLAVKVGFLNWRMFPNLGYTRIPSGRLNCKEPNLLAMPTRTERGRDIRRGFPAEPGWKIVSIDESQIEPRLATHRSQDPNLLRVYQNGEDVYSDFAMAAFRIKDRRYRDDKGVWKYPGVDKMAHRRPAKTCVLASIYSVTARGLQEQMPVICQTCSKDATEHTCDKFVSYWTEERCEQLIAAFYQQYEGLLGMQQADHRWAMKHGYICDMVGRMLHVAAVRSVHDWVVSGALREVTNFPMQSGAQATIKLTMAAVMDDLEAANMLDVCKPLLQVHDELLFEVRDDVVQELSQLVVYRFETCVKLTVDVEAGCAVADTWGDLPK